MPFCFIINTAIAKIIIDLFTKMNGQTAAVEFSAPFQLYLNLSACVRGRERKDFFKGKMQYLQNK